MRHSRAGQRRSCRGGFTLIELSIVLVIIGLIVGGILVGRDLIKAAENRATLGEYEKFKTAAMTFRLKYNCIPSKCWKAVALGLADSGGVADPYADPCIAYPDMPWLAGADEICWDDALNFWYQLARAGLIGGAYVGYSGQDASAVGNIKAGREYPIAAIKTQGWWINGNNPLHINQFSLLDLALPTPTGDFASSVTPSQGYYLDTKVDDGLPDSGRVLAYLNTALDSLYLQLDDLAGAGQAATRGPAGNPVCVNSDVAPPGYNLGNDGAYCAITMSAGF